MTRNIKRGFTLVEILIVVIILGILAAIVIPQFTNASQDARRSSMTSQLQTLRSQIELYKLQHRDKLPGGDAAGAWSQTEFWRHLTSKTDADGVATTLATGFGPYLQAESKNNLVDPGTDQIAISIGTITGAGAVTPADGMAYIYDYGDATTPGSGKIWAVQKTAANAWSVFPE
jgi:general secretion pathway protein G